MSKVLTTHGKKKLSTLMKEFNELYPYLCINFFPPEEEEKRKRGETIHQMDINKTLSEVRTKKGSGEITFNGNKKVATIEREFKEIYGVYVEICYYSKEGKGHYTSGSDDQKTLSELNNEKAAEGCLKGKWK
jgi:hypothetical protein